jgi:hypothetical protein
MRDRSIPSLYHKTRANAGSPGLQVPVLRLTYHGFSCERRVERPASVTAAPQRSQTITARGREQRLPFIDGGGRQTATRS